MEPAPELCALLGEYYAASARGDAAMLDRLLLRDAATLVIGTDATEWWRGETIAQTWGDLWRQRGGLPVEGSQPQAFRDGQVGWLDDRAAWRLPSGRSIPFRLTAVFHHDGAQWRLVQAHFSLGVPNDAAPA